MPIEKQAVLQYRRGCYEYSGYSNLIFNALKTIQKVAQNKIVQIVVNGLNGFILNDPTPIKND